MVHHFRCHSVAPPLCRGFLKGCFAETPVNKTIEDSDDPHSCLPCSKSWCVMWVLRLRGDAAPGQKWGKTDSEVVGRPDGWRREKNKTKTKKRGVKLYLLFVIHCLPAKCSRKAATAVHNNSRFSRKRDSNLRWRLLLLKSERAVFLKHASSSNWCVAFLKKTV